MINALIIDDERLARQELRNLLKVHPEVNIVDEYGNPDKAIEGIKTLRPDLIFLDIQMPGKNGFDLLEALDEVPMVIFVTAYDEYAIQAFDVNALDYLLKPIEEDRLAEALKKVMEELQAKSVPAETEANQEVLTKGSQVFIKDGERCWFVELTTIRLFESEGNYIRVYFEKNKPLILKSLNNLDKRLDDHLFFRANRKHIINLQWVDKIENWFNGGLRVTLKGGEEIEISRRQAVKLKERMSL